MKIGSKLDSRTKYCKVCEAQVTRRKDHLPGACEACQKFFRRHCSDGIEKLQCTAYDESLVGKCVVHVSTRPGCPRCRFMKCLRAGMTSKFFKRPNPAPIDDNVMPIKKLAPVQPSTHVVAPIISSIVMTTSPTEAGSKSKDGTAEKQTTDAMVPLVSEPVCYDGAIVEESLRTSIKAFTRLHDYHFIVLKDVNEPITDPYTLLSLTSKDIEFGLKTALSYCQHLATAEGLTPLEMDQLMGGFTTKSLAIFSGLQNNNSSFMNVSPIHKDSSLAMFPNFREPWEMSDQLREILRRWSPNFIECALLVSLLFFNEKALSSPKLARIRRRLCLAFNLIAPPNGHSHETRLQLFASSLRLIDRLSERFNISLREIGGSNFLPSSVSHLIPLLLLR